MREFLRIIEAAQAAPLLFHTTSAGGAHDILQQCVLRHDIINKDVEPYVSFSEKPLIGFTDISSSEVAIGFHPYAFWGKIERVQYTEEWYANNMEKAAYIAGEGWSQQWEAPEDAYDEDGFEDADSYGKAYDDAQLDAFMDKENEHEWISRYPRESLSFSPTDVVTLMVRNDRWNTQNVNEWRQALDQLGYQHVELVPAKK